MACCDRANKGNDILFARKLKYRFFLSVPGTRLMTKGKKSFLVRAPKLWNDLHEVSLISSMFKIATQNSSLTLFNIY